jgi:hypothetical protein
MQQASLQNDLSKAWKVNDLVQMYLKAGSSPKYIAHRYGVDLERCERYVAALKQQQEKRRERDNAMRGDSETPESREIVNGSGGADEVRVAETRGADMGPEETGTTYRQANG